MGLSKNTSKKCHLLRPSFLAMATTVLEEELEACSSFAILQEGVRSNFPRKANMCFGFAIQSLFFYKLTSGLSSLSFSLPAAAPSMLSLLLVGD